MFRSAVLKLTAAYLGIIMTISIIFSFVLYRVAVHELQTGLYNQYTRWYNAYELYGLRSPGTFAEELALRSGHILEQIIWFNLLVLLITGIACYLLARRTLRPIEAAHEQLKRFTADVSHELRTPLTALKMETEVALLDAQAPADELRSTLTSNLEEVQRMEALINNLLQLSSLEANKLRTEFVELDIRDVLSSAAGMVHRYAEMRHITISSQLRSHKLRGDRASLTQLFVILLENAIKYSPDGENITVRVLPGTPSDSQDDDKPHTYDDRLTVAIDDQGSGIPAAALPHIFDRFYRADSARSAQTADSGSGFGLGLSLAKLIADLHNAEIVLTSSDEPGRSGTTARVILPAAH